MVDAPPHEGAVYILGGSHSALPPNPSITEVWWDPNTAGSGVQSYYPQLGHKFVIQQAQQGTGGETDQLGLGSPLIPEDRQERKKMEHNLLICINNQFTSFNLRFMCSFSLWIPADSVWPSLIITSLSLVTGHNAKAACQKEPFSPVGTAGALVCLHHTSENDWCEESCQIRLSGFPPLTPPDSRLHVHGWGHRPRPSESGLYCWGLID